VEILIKISIPAIVPRIRRIRVIIKGNKVKEMKLNMKK